MLEGGWWEGKRHGIKPSRESLARGVGGMLPRDILVQFDCILCIILVFFQNR